MIYLIKSHVNGDLGVSDHIVEEADPVIGTYGLAPMIPLTMRFDS